jgi:transposase
MKEVFGAISRSRIALETGMHSPWVSRLLRELGHEVIVAHARNVRLMDATGRVGVLVEVLHGSDADH